MMIVPGSAFIPKYASSSDPFAADVVIVHHLDDLYDTDNREWETTYSGIIDNGSLVTRDYPTGLTDKIFLQDADFECSGDYTAEIFMSFGEQPSAGAQVGQGIMGGGTTGPWVYLNCQDGGNTIRWFVNNSTRTTTVSVNEDTEYHLAVCRSGTTTYLWLDGDLVDSVTGTVASVPDSQEWLFGGTQLGGNNLFKISIAEIRLTKAARYTSTFTPPAKPFPDP